MSDRPQGEHAKDLGHNEVWDRRASRRSLLQGAGLVTAGLVAGGVAVWLLRDEMERPDTSEIPHAGFVPLTWLKQPLAQPIDTWPYFKGNPDAQPGDYNNWPVRLVLGPREPFEAAKRTGDWVDAWAYVNDTQPDRLHVGIYGGGQPFLASPHGQPDQLVFGGREGKEGLHGIWGRWSGQRFEPAVGAVALEQAFPQDRVTALMPGAKFG